ncbi:hypothetical protein [Halobacillus sp. A5]|uniref:hypothetical protein n=1 Tax=Halobacillus sp. A5 TaxID=2880263 RepID=UPI0020A6D3E7|nr:hypothetical protein [Halobacillus sp. A5]MCP3029475.1 hypothetical protein [Halobacillus sp. A5]
MTHKSCPKCEGEMILCYVDQGSKGILVKNADGDKLFGNKKNTRINPNICADCGWVEWYAVEPGNLK